MRTSLRLLACLAAALLLLPAAASANERHRGHGHKPTKNVSVQLLAINDLHGHLAPNTPGTIQVGSATR
jgi:2',3'-cyclic-nucleotide 2'-phosphodiesterase (5'-nucleotidase family)